jgi:hypothetical protein
MFGVDSDDGFEDEAPQRVDAAAGPATVERRLEKWDALARTLSDDEEDGATEDAKDAAAAYARLVEVCGSGPNDWEVLHDRVAVREHPSTAAPLLGMRRKGAIISVEHAREGLWLKLAGEDGWMLAHGRELGLGMLVRPCDGPATTPAPGARVLSLRPLARGRRGARGEGVGAVDGRLEPTETNETAEARVVDSEDLMPRVLDFLGMGDAFTGNARAVVSKLWRAAAEKTKPRMSFHTFNGISASIHGPDDVWYDMSAPGEPRHIYSAKDLFRDDVRAAVSQRLKEEHPSWTFHDYFRRNYDSKNEMELLRELGRLWKELDDATKQKYVDRLPAAKERYTRQYKAWEAKQLEAADLKDILVGHAPAEIKLEYGVFRAPEGGWTVGSLFDAIAEGQPGYGDHTFFEGLSGGRDGYYSVMYGS